MGAEAALELYDMILKYGSAEPNEENSLTELSWKD